MTAGPAPVPGLDPDRSNQLSSGRRESHSPALADPGASPSAHRAPVIRLLPLLFSFAVSSPVSEESWPGLLIAARVRAAQASTMAWYRGCWRRLQRFFASRGVQEFPLDLAMGCLVFSG